MKIKNVETRSDIFLAPMAGVTDEGFRELCVEYGAGLTYTEMVSAKALYNNSKKTMKLLRVAENEKPIAVQLFGHEPEVFYQVIKSGVLDKFDIIDINMGCPAPKIVKNGDGSFLLRNMELASEIIKKSVEATDKPITVKFRMGYRENDNVAVEFAKMCERSGASAITIHGRTKEQMYSGKANYDVIRDVVNAVSIPVIGNGDVVDKKSYEEMLKTGVSAVMIGRGALGQPELFSEIQGKKVKVDKLQQIKQHYETLKKSIDEKHLVQLFKKHLLWYVSGYHNSVSIKKSIVLLNNFDEIYKILQEFFNNLDDLEN